MFLSAKDLDVDNILKYHAGDGVELVNVPEKYQYSLKVGDFGILAWADNFRGICRVQVYGKLDYDLEYKHIVPRVLSVVSSKKRGMS